MRIQLYFTKFSIHNINLSETAAHIVLYVLFFISGCSALMYQVIWQRMLFTVFGVDIISTTVIISVFMLGLGVGGILGGKLADDIPAHLLKAYVLIELLIAAFGLMSSTLINQLGALLIIDSELATALVSYVILAIPTLLMGATFPILVTHVNQTIKNIGESVGSLYFANTLGAAMGAYMAGFILLFSMDMTGVINCAAVLNIAVAITALIIFRSRA